MEILFFICFITSVLGIFFYAYKNRHELEKQRHIPEEEKVNITNFKKLFQSPEEIYKEEIKNGTVIVNPPSKFLLPRWVIVFVFILFFIIAFHLFNELSSMIDNHTENCKNILGINPKLLDSIMFGFFLLITIINIKPSKKELLGIQKINIGEFYPPKHTQYKYSYTTCHKVDNALIEKYEKKYTADKHQFWYIFLFFFPFAILLVISDINLPFNQLMNANEIYQQKCIAKEPPFDKL